MKNLNSAIFKFFIFILQLKDPVSNSKFTETGIDKKLFHDSKRCRGHGFLRRRVGCRKFGEGLRYDGLKWNVLLMFGTDQVFRRYDISINTEGTIGYEIQYNEK
jgi:hypothetical protein